MQADIRLRLEDGAPVVDDVEDEVGQVVGHVHAAPAHAGEGQQLAEPGGNALVAADFDEAVIRRVAVEPEAAEDVFHEVFGHAVFDGLLVVRIEVLVDAAERDAGARVVLIGHDQHVGHPERLDRFPEVGGTVPGDLRGVLRHLEELLFPDRVVDLVRALLAVHGELLRQFLRDGAGRHHGAQLSAFRALLVRFGQIVVQAFDVLILSLEAVVDDLLVIGDEVAGRGAGVAVAVFEEERHALARFLDEPVAFLLFRLGQTHGRHDIEAAAAQQVARDDLHRDLVHDDLLEEVRLPLDEALLPEVLRHRDLLRQLFERAGEGRQERVVLRHDIVRHLIELAVPGSTGGVARVLVVPFAIHAFEVIVAQPFRPRTELAWLFDRVFILDRH